MKNTKTEIRFFSVSAWKKEEAYLREQHKAGWEFSHVNGLCCYHFRRCEPKDVVYQLDYHPDSAAKQSEYLQMFRDCGWEYLQNYVGYSYFRKAASEMDGTEEEIFCDDASRLDMLKRVFVGRMLPLLAFFLTVILPQIYLQSHTSHPVMFGFFCVMFVLYLAMFISFAIPYLKYYKAAHRK